MSDNIAKGIELLKEIEGAGEPARKGDRVVYDIRMFLNKGGEVLINEKQPAWGSLRMSLGKKTIRFSLTIRRHVEGEALLRTWNSPWSA